jgi:hypothetical protein
VLESNSAELMHLRVTDINGSLVEFRNGIRPGTQIKIGESWKPGIYILHVVQGMESKTIKLVKK